MKRRYHHGSLKQALLDAAIELLAEGGPGALTLAELAKRVGVTPAAPYRHYGSRDDLMAELARRGFELFGDSIEKAWDEGRPNAPAAMQRLGAAYLRFALEEPGLYGAMFGAAATLNAPEPADAADHALEIVWRAVVALLQHHKAPVTGARQLALQVWALSHGVAMLTISGHLDPSKGVDPALVLDSALANLMTSAVLVEA